MKLKIYGASDDLVEIEGGVDGECCAIDGVVYVKVGDETCCTMIRMEYAPTYKAGAETVWAAGCWVASIFPLDEDVPMHAATVTLGGRGYSAEVRLDVPDGTSVVWRAEGRDWEAPE